MEKSDSLFCCAEVGMDKYKRIETIRNKWCARFDEEPNSWITVNMNGEADDFSKAVVETLKAYIKRYLS